MKRQNLGGIFNIRFKAFPQQYSKKITTKMFLYNPMDQLTVNAFTWVFVNPTGFQNRCRKESTETQYPFSTKQDEEKNLKNLQPLPIIIKNTNSQQNYCRKNDEIENAREKYIKMRKEQNRKSGQQEEEYRPNIPQNKKGRKTPQNSNRNVLPNVMHQVISFMQKKNKSGVLVENLISRLGIEHICTVKRFYLYQILMKDKFNHYVNGNCLSLLSQLQEPLCDVYSQEQQMMYNKICRILVHHFLTHEYDPIILTSKRVNSDKKKDHIVMKRILLEKIEQMF